MGKFLLRGIALASLMAVIGAAYISLPFWTARAIHEAVHDNDSGYLERKIEWASVRSSLKESLVQFSVSTSGELTPVPETPTLWQRITTSIGRGAVEQFVNTTVTPTGLAGLFTLRKAYRTGLDATPLGDSSPKPSTWERLAHVWSRVTRAEFVSLNRFEMDMIDKDAPGRTFNCTLELRGLEWKMTELRVKLTDPAKARLVKAERVERRYAAPA